MYLNENPLCVHKHLKELVKQAVPFIEVVNREQLVEAGHKYREEIIKLKQEILSSKVGTLAGDRILEDAENDPLLHLKDDEEDGDNVDGEDKTYGAGKLN